MQNNTKGKAIAALVLGIASVALPWFYFSSIVSIVTGIVGIILGMQVRKAEDENKNMATAGFVLSIIGLSLSGFMLVCTICTVCLAYSSAAGIAALY